MVFIDWEALGICKFWMVGTGGDRACTHPQCKWAHPRMQQISELWENPGARLAYARRLRDVNTDRSYETYRPTSSSSASRPTTSSSMNDFGSSENRNSNREPLGRPNRLFEPPLTTPANGSSVFGEFPLAGARTIWQRSETPLPPQQAPRSRQPNKTAEQARSEYWERVRARKAAQAAETERCAVNEGKEKGNGAADVEDPCRQTGPTARDAALGTTADMAATTTTSPPPIQRDELIAAASSPPDPTANMGATKRTSSGDAKPPVIGPHPSTIHVAARYLSQAALDKRLHPPNLALDAQERSIAEAREDSVRLQGVTWLDNTRRALQLPIRTFTTACANYHRFRLAHPGATDYNWADAAAAALLMSCKAEDTLKKSRDILAAAYNLKAGGHDALTPDDVVFEAPSRVVIGLERLMLESSGFDFRSKYPHKLLAKIAKSLPDGDERKKVAEIGWTVATDLHRTLAPLKQTTSTMALACLELAANMQAASNGTGECEVKQHIREIDPAKWSTTREEIMETLLDLLDLYTHHTAATILGTKYSLDDFLRIRLTLNKECAEKNIPRFTTAPERTQSTSLQPAGATAQVANGHPTPVSPPQQQQQSGGAANANTGAPTILPFPPVPEGGGTLRFMLNPQMASDEKAEVKKYYVEEWEDYEEEIEVPLPKPAARNSPDRRTSSGAPPRDGRERAGAPPPRHMDDRRGFDERRSRDDFRERDRRDSYRDRERERERDYERARMRDSRYGERRYEDRYDRAERERHSGGGGYDRRRERR